jgi:hypothetical protein
MGKLKYLKKLLGLLSKKDDKVAREVSKRTSKVDEEQVKETIDKASEMADKKSKK